MKHTAWFLAVFIIVTLLCAVNIYIIYETADRTAQLVKKASAAEFAGNAESFMREAFEYWESSSGYMFMVVRHTEMDNITVSFERAIQYLKHGDSAGYYAESAAILSSLEHIKHIEQFKLQNIF